MKKIWRVYAEFYSLHVLRAKFILVEKISPILVQNLPIVRQFVSKYCLVVTLSYS